MDLEGRIDIKWYKFLNNIWNVITWVSLILLTSFVFTGIFTGKPSMFGYRVFYVPTTSMEPTIMSHSFIVAKTVDADDVQPGDIVTYYRMDDKKVICHRIIAKTEGGFIFKGDNNQKEDPLPVENEAIGYRVIWPNAESVLE